VRLLGNLDCEARWAGVALPAAVQRRISLYATLLAACAPDDDRPEIWVPAEVDAARLCAHPRWAPPVVRWPAPPEPLPGAFDLAWADPAAAAANDRSRALAIAGRRVARRARCPPRRPLRRNPRPALDLQGAVDRRRPRSRARHRRRADR